MVALSYESVTLAKACPDSLSLVCVLVVEVLALGVARPRVFQPLMLCLPSARTLQAIALYVVFTQAERLKPEGWKENRLFLAKCYIGQWIK